MRATVLALALMAGCGGSGVTGEKPKAEAPSDMAAATLSDFASGTAIDAATPADAAHFVDMAERVDLAASLPLSAPCTSDSQCATYTPTGIDARDSVQNLRALCVPPENDTQSTMHHCTVFWDLYGYPCDGQNYRLAYQENPPPATYAVGGCGQPDLAGYPWN